MKNLIFLLSLVVFIALSSCAEQRKGAREVRNTVNAAAAATGQAGISNMSNLYYIYHTRAYKEDLNCSEVYNFSSIYKINLPLLHSVLPHGFVCVGNLQEFIIAVEVNQAGTGGNLFLYFRPNFEKDLNETPELATTNYILTANGSIINEALVVASFSLNQNQTYNSFGNFYANLDGSAGTLSMVTQNNSGIDYILQVALNNGHHLIDNAILYHFK